MQCTPVKNNFAFRKILLCLLTILTFLGFFTGKSIAAENISVTQHLSFGKIVVTKNDAVYTLAIDPSLGVLADPAFVVLEPGEPGVFSLTGFSANMPITASIQPSPSQTNFQSGSTSVTQFDLTTYLETTSFSTDINGQFQLKVFGTLKTSGSGEVYLDGTYYREYTVIFNYN